MSSGAVIAGTSAVREDFSEKKFGCTACGKHFALKTSLQVHLDRRVVTIEGFCQICQTVKCFHNRCSYLQHSIDHHTSPEAAFTNVKVKPYAAEMIEKEFDKTFTSPMFTKASDLTTLYAMEFGRNPKIDNLGSDELTFYTGTLAAVTYHCTECKKRLATTEELQAHFAYNLPANQRQLICQQSNCMAVYFSKCSYLAHMRSHLASNVQSPYTCAECGLFQPSASALSRHLYEHKTVPTVLNAWRCSRCSMFYANFDTLLQHTATAHCISTFGCTRCSIDSLESEEALEQHEQEIHGTWKEQPSVTIPNGSSFSIVKCFQCSESFNSKDLIIGHLRTHLDSTKPFQIYRCPPCGRLLENKIGLICHYERVHQLKISAEDVKEKLYAGNI